MYQLRFSGSWRYEFEPRSYQFHFYKDHMDITSAGFKPGLQEKKLTLTT